MAKTTSKRDVVIGTVLGLAIAVVCFYSYSLRNDPEDTYDVYGEFQQYKVIGGGKSSDHYLLTIDGIDYKVPSIYRAAFNETQFLQYVNPGDTLHLIVTGSKSIYQVSNTTTDFIHTKTRIEATAFNFKVALVLGIASLIMIGYLVYGYLRS